MNNYYTILELSETATDEQIKQAYRSLAKRYHPDLHPNDADTAKKFALVNEAMEVLGTPAKRKEYDAKRNAEKKQAEATAARAAAANAARAAAAARASARPVSSADTSMYMGTAQGAATVINDAYRRGYNEATAIAQQQKNAAMETWKKSAENWKAEAEKQKAETEKWKREAERQKREAEGYSRDVDTLKAALERTRQRATDAEAATRRAETELRVQLGAAEIAKKTAADVIAEREALKESLESKITVEREARKYSDADKVRLSREVIRLKEENAALKEKLHSHGDFFEPEYNESDSDE